MFSVGDNAF